jgi:hypothetical protein
MLDRSGRIFWWRDEPYRAVAAAREGFYRELLKPPNNQALFDGGLVATEIAPYGLEGAGLVLRHHRVPFRSYCMEWCGEMLRDAALLVCDLSLMLLDRGLTLTDVHPWNVFFDGGQPVFVDWGSVGVLQPQSVWPYAELSDFYILPLSLMAAGRSSLARLLMREPAGRLLPGELMRLVWGRLPPRHWFRLWRLERRANRRTLAPADLIRLARQVIADIPLAAPATEWSAYEGPERREDHQRREDWPEKPRIVCQVLEQLRPATVLDIGTNRGWYAERAAELGSRVVALDIDEPSLTALYRRVRQARLPILPLLMDVAAPTAPHGLALAYPDARDRLQADLVLALALTHHLVIKRKLNFEFVARQLAAYARRWLLVEFVPADDTHVSQWMRDEHDWYKLEAFLEALQPHFAHLEVLPSSPQPRVLVLCER